MDTITGTPNHPDRIPEALLTVDDVATLLGVTKRSVRNYAAAGKLSKIKIGANVRFDPADVAVFIRNGAQEGSK